MKMKIKMLTIKCKHLFYWTIRPLKEGKKRKNNNRNETNMRQIIIKHIIQLNQENSLHQYKKRDTRILKSQ